jgi:acyl-CoA thioesterase FadM
VDYTDPFTGAARVRFDEAEANGLARTSSILRYLQDVAWQHSEATGFDRTWYEERGLLWLVRAVEITIEGPARHGDTLTIETQVRGWRRVWAYRTANVQTVAGAPVARARIDWVLLTYAGRPARIPPEITGIAPSDAGFAPAHVESGREPETGVTVGCWTIRPSDIDPMGHVNNAAYVDELERSLLGAGAASEVETLPRTASIEYLRPALPGMTPETRAWRTATGWAWRLVGPDGMDLARAALTYVRAGAGAGPGPRPTNRS